MLKYADVAVTFAEVPDEIPLCINISNCPCHCEGCHSSYLAEDIGDILDVKSLDKIISKYGGISCVSFMGGDSEPLTIDILAKHVKEKYNLKVCWYSGRQELNEDIELGNFDYIKLGPYKEEFGPLNSRTTNQKFYKVEDGELVNVTSKFWNNDRDGSTGV